MDGRTITMDDRIEFVRIDQDEFERIDFAVMRIAFGVQNDLGTLFREHVYRNELKLRLTAKFKRVDCEVPISISFESFSKTFLADLVVDSKVIYELKAVNRLVDAQRLQLRQYLLLTNLKHGKLVNFGSEKVQGEYVSTSLTYQEQRRLRFEFDKYDASDETAKYLKNRLTQLLKAWGGFMKLELCYEAIRHFLGGDENVIRPIAVFNQNNDQIGIQNVHLLSPETAFKITALSKEHDNYRKQLTRFLQRTQLRAIQWINIDKHDVNFETVTG